jgi:hypothetical protein
MFPQGSWARRGSTNPSGTGLPLQALEAEALLLLCPSVQRKKTKTVPPDFQPRQSSRLKKGTGAPAAVVRQVRVSLITRLGLAGETGCVPRNHGSTTLSRHQVAMLAEAFDWVLPEEVEAAAPRHSVLTGPSAAEA